MNAKREQEPAQPADDSDVYPPYTPVPTIIDEGSPLYEGPRVVGTAPDGKETVVPSVPYEWWVDSHGNGVPLVVSTHRDPNEPEDRYGNMERKRRAFLGWRPFSSFASVEERQKYMADLKAKRAEAAKVYTDIAKNPAELFGENAGKAIEKVLGAMTDKMAKAERGKVG